MRKLQFIIQKENENKSIREFLKEFGFSSALITRLKQSENAITKNGKFAKTIEILHSGDVLNVNIENHGTMPTPVKMDVEILYE